MLCLLMLMVGRADAATQAIGKRLQGPAPSRRYLYRKGAGLGAAARVMK